MIQPAALKTDEPLTWSPGRGTDVWELFCACIDGDLEAVQRFSWITALTCTRATKTFAQRPSAGRRSSGQKAMVEFLLQRGASPNLPDDPPWATPPAWATRREYPEIAELLWRHGGT